MHYPFWYVPGLTSPMWIAIVAVLHVFVALYAVGGSIILAFQTGRAYRQNDKQHLEYLRSHSWFFILITLVYSSLLGVGIWWTIGLASPLATEDLIQIFVLAWAMEYVTFIVEIVSAFAFFYGWRKLTARAHTQMAWIYAGAAFASLVIITAITSFMLNTGGWTEGDGFWLALLNPQALPQIAARTGGSLLLGALYFFVHSTFKIKNNDRLLREVGRESSKWAMLGAVLTIIGGAAWYVYLPPSAKAALAGAAVLNLLMFIVFMLTAATVVLLYCGPYRNPGWLTPGFAILFLGIGLAATGTGEFIRESVRKPYIVYGRVLGSQIRTGGIPKLQKDGYLNGGVWTRAYVGSKFPELIIDGKVDAKRLFELPTDRRTEVGHVIFQYHCGDCHSVEGYSSVAQLSTGWDRDLMKYTVKHLEQVHFFMPPWAGNDAEADALTDYLMSIRHPHPEGLPEPRREAE